MRVLAYCAADYIAVTRRAAGVEPLACPPLTAATFNPRWLENRDLLFFNLHSLPSVPALLGSPNGLPVALKASQLEEVDLGGAVVFAEACFLGDAEHPMRKALFDAGASVVIAGPGRNYGSALDAVKGADLLGLWIRRILAAGMSVGVAMALARARLHWAARQSASARDALGFKVFKRDRG